MSNMIANVYAKV